MPFTAGRAPVLGRKPSAPDGGDFGQTHGYGFTKGDRTTWQIIPAFLWKLSIF